jgi:hypothetical protein
MLAPWKPSFAFDSCRKNHALGPGDHTYHLGLFIPPVSPTPNSLSLTRMILHDLTLVSTLKFFPFPPQGLDTCCSPYQKHMPWLSPHLTGLGLNVTSPATLALYYSFILLHYSFYLFWYHSHKCFVLLSFPAEYRFHGSRDY